jgi:hypothetical protein
MLLKQPKATHTTGYSILADRAITALFVLIVLFSSSLFLAGTAMAAGASAMTPQIPLSGYCNNPDPYSGHCYAERYWPGYTGGANTLINPYGALNCQGCTGFITDEMWFSDPYSSQCTSTAFQACWVEAGVSTYPANDPNNCIPGYDSTCLFWADERPNGGGYHEHPLYTFGGDGVDLTPYLIYITIANNNGFSSSGSAWSISTLIYESGNLIANPGGLSTNNTMNVDRVTIGSELSDSGASAGDFYFQDNQWMNGSGVWKYQTTTGTNDSTNPPPYGYWQTSPCSCSGNTGGSFETYD